MCVICVDWQKGLMTNTEAARNFHEMVNKLDPKHAEELSDEIQIALFEEELDEQQKGS